MQISAREAQESEEEERQQIYRRGNCEDEESYATNVTEYIYIYISLARMIDFRILIFDKTLLKKIVNGRRNEKRIAIEKGQDPRIREGVREPDPAEFITRLAWT